MRIAYADPPYPGPRELASCREYGCRPVRHPQLVAALQRFDGWALSSSSTALSIIVPLLPAGTRCGAWVKPNGVLGSGSEPTYSWEPVFFRPARARALSRVGVVRDSVVAHANRTTWRGAKPPEFCAWLFELLAAEPDDEFHDLFHGSGAVKRAWAQWCATAKAGGPLFVKEGA